MNMNTQHFHILFKYTMSKREKMITNSISITGVNCQNFNDAFYDDVSNTSVNIASCCGNMIQN